MADKEREFTEFLNPRFPYRSLENCVAEPALVNVNNPWGINYQFERKGYFILDSADSTPGAPVFNRTVSLRDSWSRRMDGKT